MDLDEQRLQRDSYVAAFRSPSLQRVMTSGPLGRIAVSYVEWAGSATQNVVMPWTLIDTPAAAAAFADELAATPISRDRFTSISAMLEYAVRGFRSSPYAAQRRVIDVSGDGPNNAGRPVLTARKELLDEGVVINGLPIMLKAVTEANPFDIPNLDEYYADCVIGGPGSFSLPVKAREDLAETIRRKLELEVSGLSPPRAPSVPRIQRAQATSPTPGGAGADCLIGEKLWDRYQRGYFNR